MEHPANYSDSYIFVWLYMVPLF